MRKTWRTFLLFCGTALAATGHFSEQAWAAADNLTVKAGFYGGPYYEVATFSDEDMRNMSDGTVWTYTGVDSGGFMRLCYAWGVSLDFLLDSAGVDLGSVGYLHMGTQDNYEEFYATFSADTLLRERYFYPNMIQAASPDGGEEQTLSFGVMEADIMEDAQSVPTMLAIGCTDFSRAAYTDAAWNGYMNYDKSELSEELKYRLVYGQLGLDSREAALNVQESDKWVFEINVQLTGAPELLINQTLLEGRTGEIGSRYQVDVSVNFPTGYGYLSEEVLRSLSDQVLESLDVTYDDSVIQVSQTGIGQYEMEIVGEGQTDLDVSYTRSEYDGNLIQALGYMEVSGTAPPQDSPTPSDPPEETQPPGEENRDTPTPTPTPTPTSTPVSSVTDVGTGRGEGNKTAANASSDKYSVSDASETSEDSQKKSDTASGNNSKDRKKKEKTEDNTVRSDETKETSQWLGAQRSQQESASDDKTVTLTGADKKDNSELGAGVAAGILFLLGIARAVVGFYLNVKQEEV